MKLNLDCIRDVLIELEDLPLVNHTYVSSLKNSIEKYGQDQVLYTVVKLSEAHYIEAPFFRDSNGFPHVNSIVDITFSGHEFLADIKPENTWCKISSAFKQGGSASIKTIANVAIDLGTEALKQKLGILH